MRRLLLSLLLAQPAWAETHFLERVRTDDRKPLVQPYRGRMYPVLSPISPEDPRIRRAARRVHGEHYVLLEGKMDGQGVGFFLLGDRGLEEHTRESYRILGLER